MDLLLAIVTVLFVVGGLWALVRWVDRRHRETWGDGPTGVEPDRPVPEAKVWLGQSRNN